MSPAWAAERRRGFEKHAIPFVAGLLLFKTRRNYEVDATEKRHRLGDSIRAVEIGSLTLGSLLLIECDDGSVGSNVFLGRIYFLNL